MSRIISTVTLILFTVWILPLGIFIAPSKEKLACAGQRAICLCSMKTAKRNTTSEKISFASNAGTHKEEGPSSAGHYFLSKFFDAARTPKSAFSYSQRVFCYTTPTLSGIEHIPKASHLF